MTQTCTLYAITHSLYSGRARSYLIKRGIPFRERSPAHESFKAEVLPRGKLSTIPTLVTAEGEVIRDGAAIIEHFEAAAGRPCRPPGPRQRIVSALFDAIGCEGLLRPAMHYRWNFPEDNLEFLRYHFFHSQRAGAERAEKAEHMMDKMRHAAQVFGVTDQTRVSVEALYLAFLDALDAHLEHYPYLLGWRPCIGDFGLIAPLYAHLGRDPYPARLMQQRAPRVYRWVERMNRPDEDVPEYLEADSGYLPDDGVPESLVDVLRVLAEDFVPETRAAADTINGWLAENRPEQGTAAQRTLGMAEFSVGDESISAAAQPYRFYLLQRVQDTYTALDPGARAVVDDLLGACNLKDVLAIGLDRRVGRADNLEVWE